MARKKGFDEKALLEKAAELFWRKGYHATSAQDLVDEMGLSRSSLYSTYSDKRTLFISSLALYRSEETAALINKLSAVADPLKSLEALLEEVVELSIADPDAKGCFMVNTAVELSNSDAEIAVLVRDNNLQVEDALTALIEHGQRSEAINTRRSARALARFIFATITSLRVAARSKAERQELSDILAVAIDALRPVR